MRVIECDECGETISADNDEELATRLGDHLAGEHGSRPSDDELERLVADEGYEAVDS
jgi:predicted small metal-binding protein